MASTPCGVDTSIEAIKSAKGDLNQLFGPGASDKFAEIEAKAADLGTKLEAKMPKIEQNPSLQKALQKLNGASPLSALTTMTEIQSDFGPLVSDLQDILGEVSPDLQSIAGDVEGLLGSGGGSIGDLQKSLSGGDFSSLLSKASSLTKIDTSTICNNCKNLEIKTLPDGTKRSVELPDPPKVPELPIETESYKEPQSLTQVNDMSAALLAFQDAQNWARSKLLNEFKERGFPPDISETEHRKNGNRYFSHYTYIYIKYAEIVGLDPDPTLWPRRVDPWVELKYTTDTNYIGEPQLENPNYIYDEEYAYFQQANNTTKSYEDVVKFQYENTPEEAAKVFRGTTANSYLKEI